jgi:dTDP-4-dehydrorhamnose 3,5-epimerase
VKATRLAIPEVVRLEPEIFEDSRGLFFESFSQRAFEAATGIAARFVQDNHSVSHKGVLRGLHYQLAPHAQGKLVRVLRGAAYDVAVDIREGSPSFGKWVAETLTAENRFQLWIPEGFAHGFLALEEGTEFLYKVTSFWHPESERTIRWDDPGIGVEWPGEGEMVVSMKDAAVNHY